MSRIPVPTNYLQQQHQQHQSGYEFDSSPTPRRSADIMSMNSPLSSDTRRKQSKRDETLRRKIESELSRKRPGPNPTPGQPLPASSYNAPAQRSRRQAQKGTVASLKPSPALTVLENMSVSDASQLCAAKRTDCVLVVDEEEGLSGIFTAKDLAFRVTAEGLDPRTTLVSQIMTKNPMVTRDTTSATAALQLMVEKHFRHLPVCNEDGDVVGLLDITKVFHEALAKVERSSSASAQLTAALAGVQTELGGMGSNPQAAAMMAYAEALKDKMALPDLNSVLNTRLGPPMVSARTSVREAAKMMKDRRTTAVCVMEGPVGGINSAQSAVGSTVSASNASGGAAKIAGIFTSKDVVLRVIAAGLDPGRCSVVRVMTPHPDTAHPTLSVQDALKKMHNGHYLNLPVVESDGKLVGIVDVLKLTYATLEQIEAMSDDKTSTDGGPMWSKFFDDLGQAGGPDDDNASMISGSHLPDPPQTPSNNALRQQVRNSDRIGTPFSELNPGDSASAIDDDQSEVGGKAVGAASSVAPTKSLVDDGTYIFKFRTPSGRTHRFQARHDNYDNLKEIVLGKLVTDPFFNGEGAAEGVSVHLPDPAVFTMSYTDDDGDLVTITQDGDVADAVKTARGHKTDRVVLVIQGDKVWEETAKDLVSPSNPRALETLKESAKEDEEMVEQEEKAMEEKTADPAQVPTFGQTGKTHHIHVNPKDDVMGIPRDMVLPASLGFLGIVIVGVFFATRAKK